MPRDYDYQAPTPENGENDGGSNFGSGYGNGGHVNPFNAPRPNMNRGQAVSSQSPFVNAQQRSAPAPGSGALNINMPNDSRSANNYQERPSVPFVRSSDTYRNGGHEEQEHIEEQDSWSSEFDGFSRISQQQAMFNGRRSVVDVFTDEQLQMYDRNQFSELHYTLQAELKRHPENLQALLGIALCNLSLGEPQKSAEYFAKAIDIDEAIRPSKYLNEVPSCDPDDWLDMAEELGHCGMLDGAMQLCSSIVESNQFSDRVRKQAMKVRDAIKQDYFAARERIIIGNNGKAKKEDMRYGRLVSALVFIIAPLILAVLLGGLLFYSINMSNGKTSLGHAIYRLDHLKRGDTAVERMGSCDHDLIEASRSFGKAKRFNPFTKEAYFYDMQAALLSKELGRIRSKDENNKWDSIRWQEVKILCSETQDAYNALNLPTDKDLEFKTEWQEFVTNSKKEENAPTV